MITESFGFFTVAKDIASQHSIVGSFQEKLDQKYATNTRRNNGIVEPSIEAAHGRFIRGQVYFIAHGSFWLKVKRLC